MAEDHFHIRLSRAAPQDVNHHLDPLKKSNHGLSRTRSALVAKAEHHPLHEIPSRFFGVGHHHVLDFL